MTPNEAIAYLKDPIGKREQHDEAVSMAIEALRNSPTQMSGTSDPISRQTAIHTITNYNGVVDKSVAKRLLIQLPSTQPEIIYCGDCRYKDDGIDEDGIPFLKCLHGRSYGGTRINDFCSWAERRNDE